MAKKMGMDDRMDAMMGPAKAKADVAKDKKRGIKEGSKKDTAIDKAFGGKRAAPFGKKGK